MLDFDDETARQVERVYMTPDVVEQRRITRAARRDTAARFQAGGVLEAWNEHLADPYLPRRLGRLLGEAGFEPPACDVVPLLDRGYDPDTYSAGLAPIIAAFVPGRRGVGSDEAAAWADDLARLGDDYFFSLNRYQFLATAPARHAAHRS